MERKAFLAKPKNQYHVPNDENMILVCNIKMEIITSIKVYLISQMNFNFKEYGGKKSFSNETKASISFIPMSRMCL